MVPVRKSGLDRLGNIWDVGKMPSWVTRHDVKDDQKKETFSLKSFFYLLDDRR